MSSYSLGEAQFYNFLIFACLVLTGKAAENFNLSFIGAPSIETSHLFGCTLSWVLNTLSGIGINLLNGIMYVILFVFTIALFLSVWEWVASCFTRKIAPQSVVMTYSQPCALAVGLRTESKNSVYQVSPTGKRSDCTIYGGRPVTPNLTEEEKGELGESPLLIRVSTFFIRIFYGDNGKKIAVIDRTVYERPPPTKDETAIIPSSSPLVEYSYTAHEFKVEPRSFFDDLGAMIKDLPSSNELIDKAKTYNAKVPTVLYRQEFEFASGHRVIKKQKMKSVLNVQQK